MTLKISNEALRRNIDKSITLFTQSFILHHHVHHASRSYLHRIHHMSRFLRSLMRTIHLLSVHQLRRRRITIIENVNWSTNSSHTLQRRHRSFAYQARIVNWDTNLSIVCSSRSLMKKSIDWNTQVKQRRLIIALCSYTSTKKVSEMNKMLLHMKNDNKLWIEIRTIWNIKNEQYIAFSTLSNRRF